jgi:hypothetical protein
MWYENDPVYDPDILPEEPREVQLEIMEAWFRYRYEDPAERTPHDSSEGGYIWIWGGPYNAREQLMEQFQGIVPDDVIEELVDKLQGQCFDWAPTTETELLAVFQEQFASTNAALKDKESQCKSGDYKNDPMLAMGVPGDKDTRSCGLTPKSPWMRMSALVSLRLVTNLL